MDKKIVKIIIPILMIVIIVGIWIYKNQQDKDLYGNNYEEFENYNNINNENIENTEKSDNEEEQVDELRLDARSVNVEKLTEYGLPIIIDFGADSCIPCKEMAPVLEKLYTELEGKAIIQFIDVWKYPTAARDYPIQVIPTQVFINSDGTAYIPSKEIEKEITFNVQYDYDTKEAINTLHIGPLTEEQIKMILVDMGAKI